MSPRTKPESTGPKRPRGRPRLDIDEDAVADAVAELFAEGGIEAVSIVDVAEKLSISRATLYRTVPTKEHLLGILFERSTRELLESARAVVAENVEPREQLEALIRLQVEAAIRMRRYMPVFFGGGDLPPDVFDRWHQFTRDFEEVWLDIVRNSMRSGDIAEGEPIVATRLLLGACIWISRWYHSDSTFDPATIADTAVAILRHGAPAHAGVLGTEPV